jgi:cytochrome c biogenesis factor
MIQTCPKIAGNFSLHSKSTPLVSALTVTTFHAVSHDPTRKTFLLKLLGFAAGAGFATRFFARAARRATPAPAPASIALHPETRAVARRTDTV